MPIYEYRCGSGHDFERVQSFSAPPMAICDCGLDAKRRFSRPAIVFKGSGFYKTDSRASSEAASKKPATDEKPASDEKSSTPAAGDNSGDAKTKAAPTAGAAAPVPAAKSEPSPTS